LALKYETLAEKVCMQYYTSIQANKKRGRLKERFLFILEKSSAGVIRVVNIAVCVEAIVVCFQVIAVCLEVIVVYVEVIVVGIVIIVVYVEVIVVYVEVIVVNVEVIVICF
jgi:hypothetical protein